MGNLFTGFNRFVFPGSGVGLMIFAVVMMVVRLVVSTGAHSAFSSEAPDYKASHAF